MTETFKLTHFQLIELLRKHGTNKTCNIIKFSKLYYLLLEKGISYLDFQVFAYNHPPFWNPKIEIINSLIDVPLGHLIPRLADCITFGTSDCCLDLISKRIEVKNERVLGHSTLGLDDWII